MRGSFAGICVRCIDQYGQQIGRAFPEKVFDGTSLELRYKHKIEQETWGCIRTDILKLYPFPESLKNVFLPESIVWSKIGQQYRTRFVEEALRIYYIDQGSEIKQLTAASPAAHAIGLAFWHQQVLNTEIQWFKYAPLNFVRNSVHYIRFSLHAGVNYSTQFKGLTNWLTRGLWLVSLPFGTLVYYVDKGAFRDQFNSWFKIRAK